MKLVGANPQPQVSGLEELPGKANYFLGNDPKQWRSNIPTYGKVKYHDVYPGIDLVYYGQQRQLEYDLIVAPGANPRGIRLSFEGVDSLEVDPQGNLILHTSSGELVQHVPNIYQEIHGNKQSISGRYALIETEGPALSINHAPGNPQQVRFEVDRYDPTRALVIDPVLVYSTYLGGSGPEGASGIAVDSVGSAYVTGSTFSSDFPTAGSFDTSASGENDAFVTKLNTTGSALVYSTYLGGSDFESGHAIAVDATGNAYLTGETFGPDFPTTPGAFDTSFNGGALDAFVTKLNTTGSALVYSTYLGGSGFFATTSGWGIAADPSGNAHVTGVTLFADFPTTPGAFDTSANDELDAFVTKLNTTGSALVYSTYLGGNSDDWGFGIAVDAASNAYLTGITSSANFPTTLGVFDTSFNGGFDAFVTKLNVMGSSLVYSTYLGGGSDDRGRGIAVDLAGNAYLTGETQSADFPTTLDAFDTSANGGSDAFVAKIATGPLAVRVTIDIKPGGSPNSINPRSNGNIPVAVLTTESFDASSVDPSTVRFGGKGREAAPLRSSLEDVDGDGDLDLVLHFATQQTGLVCEDSSARLTGKTFDGQPVTGSDSVRTVGCQ
jgi:hypothetical protein